MSSSDRCVLLNAGIVRSPTSHIALRSEERLKLLCHRNADRQSLFVIACAISLELRRLRFSSFQIFYFVKEHTDHPKATRLRKLSLPEFHTNSPRSPVLKASNRRVAIYLRKARRVKRELRLTPSRTDT